MPASVVECKIPSIPARLHTRGRAPVTVLSASDWLYMRHPPQRALWYGSQIPGHDHLADQSVNSRLLNRPNGSPRDVLYNDTGGPHRWDWGIAAFSVRQLSQLVLPNVNTQFKKVKGQPVGPDLYTFRVLHTPTPCLYPHCEIHAYKNGTRIKPTVKIKNSMRSVIRKRFARLADRNRCITIYHRVLAWISQQFASV
jgi:hypothetical protein